MGGKYAWMRLYMDIKSPFSEYDDIISYAEKAGVKILAMPVDSTDAKNKKVFSKEQYLNRFKIAINRWPEIEVWEIGNEVNGSWLPKDINEKIAVVAHYCKSMKKKTFLTLFLQINTDASPYDLFTWIKKIPTEVRSKLDYVGLSVYPEQAPMGADTMDMVFLRISTEFKYSKIGIAELGYWIKGQRYWWCYNKKNTKKGAAEVESFYYKASYAYPTSFGGGYWWDYITEFDKNRLLFNNIIKIRNKLDSLELKKLQ